tara:strand:+ start:607 stop:1674 length:1068 start_codon:yes stop_codon:yes gene_type:complete
MFKFFKEKIKKAVTSFSNTVEKEPEKVPEAIPEIEPIEEKEEPQKEIVEEIKKEKIQEKEVIEPVQEEPKKTVFSRVLGTKLSEAKFENLFFDLEVGLLESNVSVAVIEKIKEDLKVKLTSTTLQRGKVEQLIEDSLKESIKDVLTIDHEPFDTITGRKKPFVICALGINGSGKTTTIAKLAHYFQKQNKQVVLAAADTFRAAAIDQLQEHANKLKVKLIKHDYNSDPAAVAFDAVKHAQANNIDIVLIDTAGRIHSDTNLMNEVKKVVRIAQPDMNLFIGESITGNDCVEQAQQFNEAVGIDGVILSKADIDEKGGAALSVSYVTKKPIFFLGVGQNYEALESFSVEKLLSTIL